MTGKLGGGALLKNAGYTIDFPVRMGNVLVTLILCGLEKASFQFDLRRMVTKFHFRQVCGKNIQHLWIKLPAVG